jgi:hypothetical protein
MRSLDLVADDLASLAYELSFRALSQQEAAVNELRARTGTILAASSVVASFLGGRAIDRAGFDLLTGLGLLGFAISILLGLAVLSPREGLVFAVRGSALFEAETDDPGGIQETKRRLAYWIEGFRDKNQPAIDRMYLLYRGTTTAVLIEAILWSVGLALA